MKYFLFVTILVGCSHQLPRNETERVNYCASLKRNLLWTLEHEEDEWAREAATLQSVEYGQRARCNMTYLCEWPR